MKRRIGSLLLVLAMVLSIGQPVFALETAQQNTSASNPAEIAHNHTVPFSQVNIQNGFWREKQKQFILEVVPTGMENISKKGGGMNNFRLASEYLATKEGENYTTLNAPRMKVLSMLTPMSIRSLRVWRMRCN